MSVKKSEQQMLNDRARAVGGQINKANGFDVRMKDDTLYRVSTRAELYSLINNLELQAGNK